MRTVAILIRFPLFIVAAIGYTMAIPVLYVVLVALGILWTALWIAIFPIALVLAALSYGSYGNKDREFFSSYGDGLGLGWTQVGNLSKGLLELYQNLWQWAVPA